jgi:hypothetical protein
MRVKHLLLIAAVLSICSCATLSSDQHTRELADNRQNDGYCTDHGLHYPDPGYMQCRRELVDRRLYRDWQNLGFMRQVSQPAVNPVPPAPFRSPDPTSFHCRAEPQFGTDYVFCGYDDTAADSK